MYSACRGIHCPSDALHLSDFILPFLGCLTFTVPTELDAERQLSRSSSVSHAQIKYEFDTTKPIMVQSDA